MATRYSGPQKAAILLLALGEETAAEVLKNLNEAEIQDLAQFIGRLEEVTPRDVDRVANEYYRVAERKNFIPGPPETKVGYLRGVLNRALGEEKATRLVDGMLAGGGESTLQRLTWHAPSTIADFLGGEHPQVIAVILANLGDPNLAMSIISHLPQGVQQDVYQRLARYKAISQELLDELEQSLQEEIKRPPAPRADVQSGTELVADVLETSTRAVESKLLRHIEQRNPELAEKIRGRMFVFEDFIKIDNYGIQQVLQQTTNNDLVLALKTASEPLQRHFFRNMSTDSVRAIQEALGAMGPVRISEIEAAQKRLAAIAGRLNDQGELTILDRKAPA
ncbi:MAG: flagellar motor switch protein FliG [Candidatus Lambdaproteobacteria bacterium]|nr:flagellar motor switch protein FliG [Candidatus Lambdaproteobacteria bacterium]